MDFKTKRKEEFDNYKNSDELKKLNLQQEDQQRKKDLFVKSQNDYVVANNVVAKKLDNEGKETKVSELTIDQYEKFLVRKAVNMTTYKARKESGLFGEESTQIHDSAEDYKKINFKGGLKVKNEEKFMQQLKKEHLERSMNSSLIVENERKLNRIDTDPKAEKLEIENIDHMLKEFNSLEYKKEFADSESDKDFAKTYFQNRKKLALHLKTGRSLRYYFYNHLIKNQKLEEDFMKALSKVATLEYMSEYMDIRARLLQNKYYVNLTKDMFDKLTEKDISAQLASIANRNDASDYDLIEFLSMARDLKGKITGLDEKGLGRRNLQKSIYNREKSNWKNVHQDAANIAFLIDMSHFEDNIKIRDNNISSIMMKKQALKNELSKKLDTLNRLEKEEKIKKAVEVQKEKSKNDWEYRQKKLHVEIKPGEKLTAEELEKRIEETKLDSTQRAILDEINGKKYDNKGKTRSGNVSVLKTLEHRVSARRILAESIVEKELEHITANLPSEKKRIVDAVMAELIKKKLLTVTDYKNASNKKMDPVRDILNDTKFIYGLKNKDVENNYMSFSTIFNDIGEAGKEKFFKSEFAEHLFKLKKEEFGKAVFDLNKQRNDNKELIRRLLERKRLLLNDNSLDIMHLEQSIVKGMSYDILSASVEEVVEYVNRQTQIRKLSSKKSAANLKGSVRLYEGMGAELKYLFAQHLKDDNIMHSLGDNAEYMLFDAMLHSPKVCEIYPQISGINNIDSLSRLPYSTLDNIMGILADSLDKTKFNEAVKEIEKDKTKHTKEIESKLIRSLIVEDKEEVAEIIKKVLKEDTEEEAVRSKEKEGLIGSLLVDVKNADLKLEDSYFNVNNYSRKVNSVSRKAMLDRFHNLEICRQLWKRISEMDKAVEVLLLLKNDASSESLSRWFDGLDGNEKIQLDSAAVMRDGFKKMMKDHLTEFMLGGTEISLLGVGCQGEDAFKEGKSDNYKKALSSYTDITLDRMLRIEYFLKNKYKFGALTQKESENKKRFRRGLQILAGGLKDLKGLKGLELKSAQEFNRTKYGVSSFDELMEFIDNGEEFTKRKDIDESREKLDGAVSVFTEAKLQPETIKHILEITSLRAQIASLKNLADVKEWTKDFLVKINPLIEMMEKDKEGYLLKLTVMSDFEKVILDAQSNKRDKEYWTNYRKEYEKKINSIRSHRKNKTISGAYESAKKYADQLFKEKNLSHVLSTDDILKKGFTNMPKNFSKILFSDALMKEAVGDIINKYMNSQRQIMEIVNADPLTKDLKESIKRKLIGTLTSELFISGKFTDEDKNSIKGQIIKKEIIDKFTQNEEDEFWAGWENVDNKIEKEYFEEKGNRAKKLGTYKDKDLSKMLELNGLKDTDCSIYSSIKKAKGLETNPEYTANIAASYLEKVNENLAAMLHEDELTDNLKNFIAEIAYENRNKKNYNLKQELRFLIALYRGQKEYFFLDMDRAEKDNENDENPLDNAQNLAERAAIFAFLNISNHKIAKDAATIKKYERKAPVASNTSVNDSEWVFVKNKARDAVSSSNDSKAVGDVYYSEEIAGVTKEHKIEEIIEIDYDRYEAMGGEIYRDRAGLSDEEKKRIIEIAKKREKKRQKEDKAAYLKRVELEKKHEKFEKKHPEYQIPKLSMDKTGELSNLEKRFAKITRDFKKNLDTFEKVKEEYKNIENPVIKEEYRKFLSALQIEMCTMPSTEFQALTLRRQRYFSMLTDFMKLCEEALKDNEHKDKYLNALRDYYRDSLSKNAQNPDYVFDNEEWKKEIALRINFNNEEYSTLTEEYNGKLSAYNNKLDSIKETRDKIEKETDATKKKKLVDQLEQLNDELKIIMESRIETKKKLNAVNEGRLENYLSMDVMGDASVSNYYYGQKTQDSFNKLIEKCGNNSIVEEFKKLDSNEKLLLAAILSVTASESTNKKEENKNGAEKTERKNINDLCDNDFALTNMNEVKEALKAYLGKDKTIPKLSIDYDAVIQRLTGQIIQDDKGLKLNEQSFNAALTIIKAAKIKKNNSEASALEKLKDSSLANNFAKKEGLAAGRTLLMLEKIKDGNNTYGIDGFDNFALRLKTIINDDLTRSTENGYFAKMLSSGHAIFEGINVKELSKRLHSMMNDENKNDLKLFVLLLQDRTVLDYKSLDKAEAFNNGNKIEKVNTQKRDLILGHLLAGGNHAANLISHGADNSSMATAIRTLLSFQLRDDCKVEGNKYSDFEEFSISRGTAIDWELVKHTFEFMDEIKREERRLDAVRKAQDKAVIDATGSEKVKNKYNSIRGDEGEKDFVDGILSTLSATDKNRELVKAYLGLNQQQKALFIRALEHRDILDISKTNSATNLIFGFERNYVNPAQRYGLIDEYVRISESEEAVLNIKKQGYADALKSLLSTQIDDSFDFSKDEKLDAKKLVKSSKRDTVIDWKLFSNALQFVFRADQEKNTMYEDRALYETMSDISENGEFSFDAAFLRRNMHTSHGRLSNFAMSRVRENIKKYIPDSKNARMLLSFVLNTNTMNKLNSYIPKAGTTGSKVNDLGEKVYQEERYEKKKAELQSKVDEARAEYEKDKTAGAKAKLDEALNNYNAALNDKDKHEIVSNSGVKGSEEEKKARALYGVERSDGEKGILISDTVSDQKDLPVDKFVQETVEVEALNNSYSENTNLYTTRINIPTELGLRGDLSSVVEEIKNAYGQGLNLDVNATATANGINTAKLVDGLNGNTITVSMVLDKEGKHTVRLEMSTRNKVNTKAKDALEEKLTKTLKKVEKKALKNNAGMKGSEVTEISKASGGLLQDYTEISGILSIIKQNVGVNSPFLDKLEKANKEINQNIMLLKSEDMSIVEQIAGFDIDAFVGLAASGMCEFMPKEKVEKITKAYKEVNDFKKYASQIAAEWMSDDSLTEKLTDTDYAKVADLILEYSTDNVFSNHKEGVKLAAETIRKLQKGSSRFVKYLSKKDKPLLMDDESSDQVSMQDTSTSIVEQLGIDNLFDLVGDYAEFFTNDAEKAKKAKTGINDVKQITVQGSKIYTDILKSEKIINAIPARMERRKEAFEKAKKAFDDYKNAHGDPDSLSESEKTQYDEENKKFQKASEEYDEGLEEDKRLLAYTEAARNGDIAKSIDIKAIGELTSLFLSKENAELVKDYSADINKLKDFAAETYEHFYKDNSLAEGLASVNMTALLDLAKKYSDKNTAMKWIMRGVGGAAIAEKGFACVLKNVKDKLMLDGVKVRGLHDTRTKIFDAAKGAAVKQRTYSDMLGQFGIDELFDIAKIIGICSPSKETTEVIEKIIEAKKAIVDAVDLIPKEVWGDINLGQMLALTLGGGGALGGAFGITYWKVSDGKRKVMEGLIDIFSNLGDVLSGWASSDDVWRNLDKLKLEGILDVTKKYDRQSFLGMTGRILKSTKNAYSAMYSMAYTTKGFIEKGYTLFDSEYNKDATNLGIDIITEKIITKFENNALVGGRVTDLYKSGALRDMVKAGKVVTENVGNTYELMKDIHSRYKISKGKDDMDNNDFEDQMTLLDALSDDEKFMNSLGEGKQGMTDYEKSLAKNSLNRNISFTRSGMDYAGTYITTDMVERSLNLAGSISKYTLDASGLMQGILGEAGEWIKFFGELYRDGTAADEYFAKGPGHAFIQKIKLEYPEKSDKDVVKLAKMRMGFGSDYENSMAFRTYIGRNIVQSILFSASKYNPMKGIRLRSELMLKVLGMEDLIGKTDMASSVKLYERLIGGMGMDLSGLDASKGIKTDGSSAFEMHDIYSHIPKTENKIESKLKE